MNNKIALDWRLRGQRYRLEGVTCQHCGVVHFPPRAICPKCRQPMNGTAEEMGLQETESGAEPKPAPFIHCEKPELALAEA